MRPEEFESMFLLMIMVALLSASYQASISSSKNEMLIIDGTTKSVPVIPQQSEWSKKAVKRYAEAQDKKWKRWREAMFE